jgi:hypothetical protein
MQIYEIGYYARADGNRPVLEYIKSKSLEDKGRIERKICRLIREGPFLHMPCAKKIGKIYELRPEGMRLFYYFKGPAAIFVHAVDKKDFTQADIVLSGKRRKELENK